MKILYGVQGTGNGHISRARMMARHFKERGADVRFLFSGRPADQYFAMGPFGDFMVRRGLTFVTEAGRVDNFKTIRENNLWQLAKDVNQLEMDEIDLVISDFEPVSAWAAKRHDVPSIGIGHQYAFLHDVPLAGDAWHTRAIMRHFAPTRYSVGLHWHHFDQEILPPIIDPRLSRQDRDPQRVMVYLPFEDQQQVTACLRQIPGYEFYQYAPTLCDEDCGPIRLRKTSLGGFKRDLSGASAVICNAGFELVSECLQLGIRTLVRPLDGQMEQQSNARALKALGYGEVFTRLAPDELADWLQRGSAAPSIDYPDVAKALVDWVLQGDWQCHDQLTDTLWSPATTGLWHGH